ncbi:MAG: fused MFS/spermidine synthase [Saprospiraceae bacterium]|nr:fused MFS/spermidine synthase [Saprospiraceae bacterium]
MKHSRIKKLLSHFIEFSLEKTSSNFNPYLEVKLVEGRHQLITEDAVYSFDDKYENFNYSFSRINWESVNVDEVLVLGLGLASVILMLETKFDQKPNFTCVEIDPEICRLAQKYTLNALESYVEVLPTDGLQFMETNTRKYDLIIMDIFQSAIIPEEFQSTDYLNLIQNALTDNGCLLYNRMDISLEDKAQNKIFRQKFNSIFNKSEEYIVRDNIVLVSNKDWLK